MTSAPRLPSAPLGSTRIAGSKLVFLSPNNHHAPHFEGFSGPKRAFPIPYALPDGFSGSISAFLSPITPPAPRSRAIPGSNLGFLSLQALPDALAGSILAFLSPITPSEPHSEALPGSKQAFPIPQPLSGAACSGCKSGAGEVYTGAPPQYG